MIEALAFVCGPIARICTYRRVGKGNKKGSWVFSGVR